MCRWVDLYRFIQETGETSDTNTCSFPQESHVVDGTSPSSSSSFEILVMESVAAPYQQVQPHWFFCRRADDDTSWLPFNKEDSDKLENACKTGKGVFEVDMDTVYCTYTVRRFFLILLIFLDIFFSYCRCKRGRGGCSCGWGAVWCTRQREEALRCVLGTSSHWGPSMYLVL